LFTSRKMPSYHRLQNEAAERVAMFRGFAPLRSVASLYLRWHRNRDANNSGDLILVEGHTRATAYAVLSDRVFPAFIGTSPLMDQWAFI
jgi:hypothetical protein